MSAIPVPQRLATAPRRLALGSPAALRLATVSAVALFVAIQWGTLQRPAEGGRMLACAALAIVAAVAWLGSGRLGRRAGGIVRGAAPVVAMLLALPIAGVSRHLLAPAGWGELVSGIGQGIDAMPGISVPYRGVDPWVRVDLNLAGAALMLIGVLLAMHALRRGARPVAAAAVLTVAYAIPVVEHSPEHPYVGGAAFAVLLGALLWADRVERRHAASALVFAGVAVIAGLVVAPKLDASRAWLDYERIAGSLSSRHATTFSWAHSYRALDWPRDGRELLRVAAKTPVYWKTVDLGSFDGVRWRAERVVQPGRDSEIALAHPAWRQKVRVTVRGLRSHEYVGAGVLLGISHSPRVIVDSAPGTYATGRQPLQRGDSYLVDAYTPRPSAVEMAASGTDYPTFASNYLGMELPTSVGGPAPRDPQSAPSELGAVQVQFQHYGLDLPPIAVVPGFGPAGGSAVGLLRLSAYAPMYALAQRLRDQSGSAYDYVRLVQRHFAGGYSYTESPPAAPRGRPPLVSFVFDTKAGYCQQFSGAMALLLRMGGVPARIASGFTPGTYDKRRREWVVRDFDAHSWVEAYFPAIGWVPFDPTPPVAPPRAQLTGGPAAAGAIVRSIDQDPRRADVPRRPADRGGPGPGADISLGRLLLAALIVVVLVGIAASLLTRARRRTRDGAAPGLAELERALRMTGRPPVPPLTLRGLEERWRRHAPGAAEYVEAVRLARFGARGDGPTTAQRAALRRELAEGLGTLGRLRAWRALPPSWTARLRRSSPYTGT